DFRRRSRNGAPRLRHSPRPVPESGQGRWRHHQELRPAAEDAWLRVVGLGFSLRKLEHAPQGRGNDTGKHRAALSTVPQTRHSHRAPGIHQSAQSALRPTRHPAGRHRPLGHGDAQQGFDQEDAGDIDEKLPAHTGASRVFAAAGSHCQGVEIAAGGNTG
nr:hypothetical protein [Tanacetum cinerariifolium]